MAKDAESFEQWLDQGMLPPRHRSPHNLAVLQAAFAFLQHAGCDYASRRIVAHFLLNCQIGLKLAQVARLVGVTRPTASRQNTLSSSDVVREVNHRLSGRPYGKLLGRHAGPIAQFVITRPAATRNEVLAFIAATFNIEVSLTALHAFLHKYGLDRQSLQQAAPAEPVHPAEDEKVLLEVLDQPLTPGVPMLPPSHNFFWATPSTPAHSCCSPKFSAGGRSRNNVSRMTTAPYSADS
jgi:hypothetical protein